LTSLVNKRDSTLSNLVFVLIFLYFFTTCADLLHIQLSLFRIKANHAIALTLCGIVFLGHRKWELDRRLFFSLCGIAISMVLSLWNSEYLPRSIAHFAIFWFTALMYFILPLNLIAIYGRKDIFMLYTFSFIATGLFAALQFVSSFFGITFPFVSQYLLGSIARGQAMAFEPSYFALYMSAYVMYWNAKQLTSLKRHWGRMIIINLLLLVSTSTGAFFAYFIFFFVVLLFQRLSWAKEFKKIVFRKILFLSAVLILVFLSFFLVAPDLFQITFWKFFANGFMAHHSFTERWQGIVNAWEVFLAHPWFGVGIGGIGPHLYKEYFAQEILVAPTVAMMELYDPTNVLTEVFAALDCAGWLHLRSFSISTANNTALWLN
jgi:O-antigen ligase